MGNKYKLATISVLLILTLGIITALGVSSPYWQGNPLKMRPGEIKDVSFNLVNSVSENTTKATVSLVEGGEIAQIISGENYTLAPGSTDKNVVLRISIPQNAIINSTYKIKFYVQYSPAGESGNVQLDVKYNIEFPIEVSTEVQNQSFQTQPGTTPTTTEPPKKSKWVLIALSILAIIILIIIIVIIKLVRERNQLKQQV